MTTTRIQPTRPHRDPQAAERRLRICLLASLLTASPRHEIALAPQLIEALEEASRTATETMRLHNERVTALSRAMRDASSTLRSMRAAHPTYKG